MKHGSRRWLALWIAAPLVATPALAREPAPSFPRHGLASAATADGALGNIVNPALLGLRYPSETIFGATFDDGGRNLAFDALGAWRGLGARYTRLRGLEQRLGFGAGFGSRTLRAGWSGEWSGAPAGPLRDFDHRLGLLARPTPWISGGAAVDHVFRPRDAFGPTSREYTLALGLRPAASRPEIAHLVGPALTLFGECRLLETVHPRGVWRFGLEAEVVSGIGLQVAINDDDTQLGVVARLPTANLFGLFTPRVKKSDALRSLLEQIQIDPFGTGEPLGVPVAPRTPGLQSYGLSLHSGEEPTTLVPPRAARVARIRVNGALGDDELSGFSLLGGGFEAARAVGPVHRRLERALEDPLTRGVFLELGDATGGAAIEELRPDIARLRAAGKPVVGYLEAGGGRGDLLLASGCTRVFASEEAMFWQLGLRVERRYYRRLLADWGLRIDRSAIGPYKSAYRTWSEDSTPPADREVLEHVLDQVQNELVTNLGEARNMDRARVETLLDGRQWPAEELKRAGLIDSVGYRDEALAMLGRMAGLSPRPRVAKAREGRAAERLWRVPRRVAVVYASGAIEMGESSNDLLEGPNLGAATLIRQLEDAFHRSEIRAVVLRIDSPGGSALAANLIHHALERLKRETRKPLVVSMGGLAASGGYYIALPGNRIFADRTTRTGSIGVVFVHPSLEGWYARHGVRQDEFERGAYMRGGSFARDWDAAAQASADSGIARVYDRFVDRVAEARGMSRERVLESAGGRVWLGPDALERGLVDEIGGLSAAIEWARKAANLPAGERIEPLEYRRPRPGLLQRLAGSWVRESVGRELRLRLEPEARYQAGDEIEF